MLLHVCFLFAALSLTSPLSAYAIGCSVNILICLSSGNTGPLESASCGRNMLKAD